VHDVSNDDGWRARDAGKTMHQHTSVCFTDFIYAETAETYTEKTTWYRTIEEEQSHTLASEAAMA